MKSDRNSMLIGMTDSGWSASFCFATAALVSCVVSLLLPRGTAVAELSRISKVLHLVLIPFVVVAAHRKVGPPNRGMLTQSVMDEKLRWFLSSCNIAKNRCR
jgi:hypothetical protein